MRASTRQSCVQRERHCASQDLSVYDKLLRGFGPERHAGLLTSEETDSRMRIWPGRPYPLGATWDGEGVNFALFSENATAVELCLFDEPDATQETHRIRIEECTDHVWHIYLPEARPGQRYGYRVHGPYEPEAGHRFNPAKLLFDPYAKAIAGTIDWSRALLYGYRIGDPKEDLSVDDQDNASSIPKCVVVD